MLSSSCGVLLVRDIVHCLNLCSRLLSKIQPIISPPPNHPGNSCSPKGSGLTAPLVASSGFATNSQVVIDVHNLGNSQTFEDSSAALVCEKVTVEQQGGDHVGTISNANSMGHFPGSKTCSLDSSCRSKWDERIITLASDCSRKEPQNVLRSCLTAFQDCFVKLVTSRLFEPSLDSQGILERLLEVQRDDDKERQYVLEQWLRKLVQESDSSSVTYLDSPEVRNDHRLNGCDFHQLRLAMVNDASEFLDAFSVACRILVDFSSFPACFVPSGQTFDNNLSQSE